MCWGITQHGALLRPICVLLWHTNAFCLEFRKCRQGHVARLFVCASKLGLVFTHVTICLHDLVPLYIWMLILFSVSCSLTLSPSLRFESSVQISKLQDLVNRSKMARCRGRFVCPVILYNGKVSTLYRLTLGVHEMTLHSPSRELDGSLSWPAAQ